VSKTNKQTIASKVLKIPPVLVTDHPARRARQWSMGRTILSSLSSHKNYELEGKKGAADFFHPELPQICANGDELVKGIWGLKRITNQGTIKIGRSVFQMGTKKRFHWV